jgi:DGQHR domain-containing protein
MPKYDYECLVSRQRNTDGAPTFLLFHAPVGEVLQWAAIRRLEDEPGAPQRQTSPAKVKAIRRFLDTDERNTIPTSIIVTLNLGNGEFTEPQAPSSVGRIQFEWNEGTQLPGLVIDGQHRLYGIQAFNRQTQVNLVAITGAGDMETAFQFLVINNKASKVSQDHIRALSLQYDEGALKERLKTARLNLDPNVGYVGIVNEGEDSPFQNMIAWPLTPEANRVVTPSAIEASITYIQQKRVKDFDSDDVLLEFFYTIWRRIRTRWPDLWTPQSRLLSKVGVICMTQYLTDALTASYDLGRLDISDPEQIGQLVDEILITQERKFWRVAWTSTSYDTKVGRALIVQSLTQIARNVRSGSPWFEDIEMVDATEIEADEVEPPAPPAQR